MNAVSDAPEPKEPRDKVLAAIAVLEDEIENLKTERRRYQQKIAVRYGRSRISRERIERLQGEPSLYVGQMTFARALQASFHRRKEEDNAARLSSDKEYLRQFLLSHDVKITRPISKNTSRVKNITVHAFKGVSGLMEVRFPRKILHLDPQYSGKEMLAECEISNVLTHLIMEANKISGHIPRPYVQVYWKIEASSISLSSLQVTPTELPILSDEWNVKLGQHFEDGYARLLRKAYINGTLANKWGTQIADNE